jgi:hypothetical protein
VAVDALTLLSNLLDDIIEEALGAAGKLKEADRLHERVDEFVAQARAEMEDE